MKPPLFASHSRPVTLKNAELKPTAFCRQIVLGELTGLSIDHPGFQATLLLQGAQLMQFQPAGQDNWLWCSDRVAFKSGQSARGGIPICAPWFGDPTRNPQEIRQRVHTQQAHGILRHQLWDIGEIKESVAGVQLTLHTHLRHHPQWTGDASFMLKFDFSASAFSASLISQNQDSQPLALSLALHTYLPTQDIRQTRIHGLEGCNYIDTLHDWQVCQQIGAVRFQSETDRIYTGARNLRVSTPDYSLNLISSGSASTVVWNPWIGKSKRLSQFSPDAWQGMFCVETANLLSDAIQLMPGESHVTGVAMRRG